MKIKTLIFFAFLAIILSSCSEDRTFPEVKKLSEYEATAFLPTLENNISKDKNGVYCVTLLYAWDEARKAINEPLEIPRSKKLGCNPNFI